MLSQQEEKIKNVSMKELSEKLLSEIMGAEESNQLGESLDNYITKLIEDTQPSSDVKLEEKLSHVLVLMNRFVHSKSNENILTFLTKALIEEKLSEAEIEKVLSIHFERMQAYDGIKIKFCSLIKTLEDHFAESSLREISLLIESLKNEPEDVYFQRTTDFLINYKNKCDAIVNELYSNYKALLKPVLNQIEQMRQVVLKDIETPKKEKSKTPVSFLFVAVVSSDKKPVAKSSEPEKSSSPSPGKK